MAGPAVGPRPRMDDSDRLSSSIDAWRKFHSISKRLDHGKFVNFCVRLGSGALQRAPRSCNLRLDRQPNWRAPVRLRFSENFNHERWMSCLHRPAMQEDATSRRFSESADTPPVDLDKVLNVVSANPFLRAIRIQNGHLRLEDVPIELRAHVPITLKTPGERQ